MSNRADKFKSKDRKQSISYVQGIIKGTEDVESVYDQYSSLELPELEAEIQSLSRMTLAARTEFHFKLALYRSLRYASANSKHVLALGLVNNVRELYEGQRIMFPSENPPV